MFFQVWGPKRHQISPLYLKLNIFLKITAVQLKNLLEWLETDLRKQQIKSKSINTDQVKSQQKY